MKTLQITKRIDKNSFKYQFLAASYLIDQRLDLSEVTFICSDALELVKERINSGLMIVVNEYLLEALKIIK